MCLQACANCNQASTAPPAAANLHPGAPSINAVTSLPQAVVAHLKVGHVLFRADANIARQARRSAAGVHAGGPADAATLE